jgi:cytochrome c oxidase subunit 3
MTEPVQAAEIPFHHFVSIEQQHEAARLGMWFFLATETLLFGGIFTSFTVYHSLYPEAFAAASLRLAWVLEAVNTVVLLASGFTMALVEHYARDLDRKRITQFLIFTILLNLTFLALKGFEYRGDYVPGRCRSWRAAGTTTAPAPPEPGCSTTSTSCSPASTPPT